MLSWTRPRRTAAVGRSAGLSAAILSFHSRVQGARLYWISRPRGVRTAPYIHPSEHTWCPFIWANANGSSPPRTNLLLRRPRLAAVPREISQRWRRPPGHGAWRIRQVHHEFHTRPPDRLRRAQRHGSRGRQPGRDAQHDLRAAERRGPGGSASWCRERGLSRVWCVTGRYCGLGDAVPDVLIWRYGLVQCYDIWCEWCILCTLLRDRVWMGVSTNDMGVGAFEDSSDFIIDDKCTDDN